MEKIGRNEPCPCGSGKKYKKCCGKSNVIQFPAKQIDDELINLLHQFQEVMMDQYSYLLPYQAPETDEEQMIYLVGLIYKGVFDVQENGESPFEYFLKKKRKTIVRPATKQAFEDWVNAVPSFFKLEKMESETTLLVKDQLDGQLYQVKRESIPLDTDELEDTPYYMGFLMNWGNMHNFFPLALPGGKKWGESYLKKLKERAAESDESSITAYFHNQFLTEVNTWFFDVPDRAEEMYSAEPAELEVLALLDQHVEPSVKSAEGYQSARNFWLRFCEETNPQIRKPEVLSASLEYFIRFTPFFELLDEGVTQKEIAQKYGVSPASIARRFDEFEGFLFDLFDEEKVEMPVPQ
ncbi:SEC-C metal-binding domain-containing protein [Halobacillus rhizosphaerae]|uniref:SEC-C metal-binding domain-containing protein n=1 Tax=Halobacillus rhizosphaerae TaxID=3064889 RepID=UPI00398BB662